MKTLAALAATCAAMYFSMGSTPNALAAWLAVAFGLLFTRYQRPVRGMVILWVATIPVYALVWSFFPFGGSVGLAVFAVIAALVNTLPFLFDRLVAPFWTGAWRTLPFPAAACLIEFVFARSGDLGSWGSVAYSQVHVPWLIQITAVTGLSGLTFLIGWGGATLASLWDRETGIWRWKTALPFLIVFLVVGGIGQVRFATTPKIESGLKVTLLGSPEATLFAEPALRASWAVGAQLTPEQIARARAVNDLNNEKILAAADRAATEGSQVVAWGEGAVVVWQEDLDRLLSRVREIARRYQTSIVASVISLPTGASERRWNNEVYFVGPDGEVLWTYRKAVPTPGIEAAFSTRGDGRMQAARIGDIGLGVFICYDIDFPFLVAQVNDQDVDILIVPSGDWPEVAEVHADMARLRAIEQGVTVLRPTTGGVSIAYGARGTILGRIDPVEAVVEALTLEVPTVRQATLYGWFGDLLAAVSLPLVLALAGCALLRRRRRRLT